MSYSVFKTDPSTIPNISCSDSCDELSVTEFLELFGELYKELGFCNDLSIKIKGLAVGTKVVKVNPNE